MPDEPLIVTVIRRYHPEWEPPEDTGREWISCLCPFHGDSRRSAGVSFVLNGFRCLGCGFGGSAATIIKQMEEVSNSTAERIAKEISPGGYEPVPRKPNRKPRRRVFAEEGAVSHERTRPEVPARVRGRPTPWT